MYFRADIFAVVSLTGFIVSYFGWQLTDKEDLLAMASLIFGCLLNSVFLLCNYWSVAYNTAIAYQTLKANQVDKCSHVKVCIDNKKQNQKKEFIVPIIEKALEVSAGNFVRAYQVEVQKKKFSYSNDKKTFSQIPYPTDDCIEFY